MKFIELTLKHHTSQKVYVNALRVLYIKPLQNGCTVSYGGDIRLDVEEDIEDVLELIEEVQTS